MNIGIYGGSFNPIHKGHVALAAELVRQQITDQVWLMVSPLNPLKQADKSQYADYDCRLDMARLATEGVSGVVVSDFERHLPVPSYTITTLEALELEYPQHQFSLVIGADNWQRFDRWYRADELRRRYPLIVYKRPGYDIDFPTVDTPEFDVSSTQIRQAISEGRDTSEWLHPAVRKYIEDKGLYGL